MAAADAGVVLGGWTQFPLVLGLALGPVLRRADTSCPALDPPSAAKTSLVPMPWARPAVPAPRDEGRTAHAPMIRHA